MRYSHLILLVCIWGVVSAQAQGVDLLERYPATLLHSEGPRAYDWTCEPEDVWALSSFDLEIGDSFHVQTGPAHVMFGKHATNVLWAVVFPEAPGAIVAAPAGEGEGIRSVWLRFHPARVATVFPPETVLGNGPEERIPWARRVYAHKINSSWQAGNRPVVPRMTSLTIDVQTVEGPRRFFMADTGEQSVKYEDYFRTRALPVVQPVSADQAREAFDTVWEAFDADYAMFTIKPEVDWKALRAEYRPKAEAAGTDYEVGSVINDMLSRLEDLHVWVRVGDEHLWGYTRPRPLNANWQAVKARIPDWRDSRNHVAWGRLPEGIGYINIYGLGRDTLPRDFDNVLERLADTRGLIIDLRFNGGGSEPLAQKMAARLIDRERVYSTNRYRNGPAHDDLGPVLERTVAPRGPWRYQAPVIVLIGRRTMSSAESFALMLAQCPQVTTLGAPTAGSSGNPRRVGTACRVTVNLPRWIDMDPEGRPIDTVGVAPQVAVDAPAEAFTPTQDPVLEAAIARLLAIPEADRQPGNRKDETAGP